MKVFWAVLPLVSYMGFPLLISGQENKTPESAKSETDLQNVVKGNNAFAFDLYSRLSKEKGNIVFSPYSISVALAMTYAGARGETAEDMAKVLHFALPEDRLHRAFGELTDVVQCDAKKRLYDIHVANAVWGKKGLGFHHDFQRISRERYKANVQELDFAGDPHRACEEINNWVEDRTKNKITRLLSPNSVRARTSVVLTNAIYFKAAWKTPFAIGSTKEALFALSAEKNKMVPMMQGRMEFKYHANADFHFIELPYAGEQVSMVILLPQKRNGLAEAEKKLTAKAVQNGLVRVNRCISDVAMPRFTIRWSASLAENLGEIGLIRAFGDRADFSAMSTARSLQIQDVIHKAFIEVDETGTVAAAATAVVGSTPFSQAPPPILRIDQPFLALIPDSRTGSFLFLARVSDPRP